MFIRFQDIVSKPGRRWILPHICSCLALLVVLSPFSSTAGRATEKKAASAPGTDGYLGSDACGQCHAQIFRQFSKTSMGRSMSLVTPELLQQIPTSVSLYDEKLDRHFEVHLQDEKLVQSEFQTDANQTEIFRDTHRLDWILGSGANGFGGILQRDGVLFQAPLSFYSKPKTWGLSPGYEFGDYGFNRPILAGCIFCHSGRPRPVAATSGRFEDPPFAELAVGCENCHGPGAAHRSAALAGANVANHKSLHIVNPARLTPALANNICMSCHQTGDVRVLKPGKTYQDFRPGTPLDDTLSILITPPTRESPPDVDHLEHYYSMTLSKCYRASRGNMRCITCHDPHIEPTEEAAPKYFAQKCMQCHSDLSCRLNLEARQHTIPPDNCIACHMPKRDIQVIRHSSITNHRILAKPDEPFPDITFQQTTAALPDLIHLNPAPGHQSDELPLLSLLQAYGELSATHSEYVPRYSAVLAKLEVSQPGNSQVQSGLGHRDLQQGKYAEAIQHLQRSLQIGPPQANVYQDLAEALAKLGRLDESIAVLRSGIAVDPFHPILQKNLVLRLIQTKNYDEAKTAMVHYLEVFPQDSFMRHMLELANNGSAK
jgi:tetratricopeptide (TPR) repeat protein